MTTEDAHKKEWGDIAVHLYDLIRRKGGRGEWRRTKSTKHKETTHTLHVDDIDVKVSSTNIVSAFTALEQKLEELPDVSPADTAKLHAKINEALCLIDKHISSLRSDQGFDSVDTKEVVIMFRKVREALEPTGQEKKS